MRAAIFNGVGKPVTIENMPDPTPGPGDVVVKVGACGICGTDVHSTAEHMFAPPPGTPLGHEFSGEVVALGSSVSNLKIGDRVAAMPMSSCGVCAACMGGHPYGCAQVGTKTGGFGEYVLATAVIATKLPEALSLADGALIEPLAAALRSVTMSRMAMTPGARVLVIGAGTMGMATVFWARRMGAGKIVVTARSQWREALALEMGADQFVVSDDALAQGVNAALGGMPDIVFEAAGAPGLMAQAINLVKPRGLVLAEGGCMQPDQTIPFIAMCKEVCIQFSGAYTLNDFQVAVDAMDRGAVQPRSMITETLPLSAMPAALESLRGSNRQCKVMIDPWMQ